MAYTCAWVIGSARDLDYDLTIDASPQTIAGSRYLHTVGGGSLSLLGGMLAAMTSAGLTGPAAVLTRDRRVRLSAAGGVFTVTWTDTGLRDLLGFTGNLAGASSYVAPNVSPLLWSPRKPLRPELSPIGIAGLRTPLSQYTVSPSDGSPFVVTHGERVDQRFTCEQVPIDRVWTTANAGGEFEVFFRTVLAAGASFYVYPSVVEDPGSTTTATLSGALGPYAFSPKGRTPTWTYRRSRGHEWCDAFADVDLPCRVVPEYN